MAARKTIWLQLWDTLGGWLQPGHELRIIALGGESAGFLHIGYHGEWLGWRTYVAPQYRSRGVATCVIALAKQLIA